MPEPEKQPKSPYEGEGRDARRRRNARPVGQRSTLLTGPSGVTTGANLGTNTLLGQ